MPVHQVLSYAKAGDAVTNHAMALQGVLAADGPSQLLAHVVDPSVEGRFQAIAGVDGLTGPDDLVLYHVTIGCRAAVDWVRSRRYGLVYHNITPAAFFDGLSPEHERLCREGREELALLVPDAETVIADSRFNAREIEALGGSVDAVQPPITTAHRLRDKRDGDLERRLDARTTPELLYIGQVAPHKQPEALVMAHHLATTHLGVEASLALVGSHPIPPYAEAVRQLIRTLGVSSCDLVGPVDDDHLATRLRRARALVTASVHEGYCVPVVEAMAEGIPVVARAAGAIPETTAGAALLVAPDAPPTVFAEALARIVHDDELHSALRTRGLERAEEIEASADPAHLAPTLAARR